jgi:predicted TIM-barrel fold metal-dependent hydrolase
MTGRPDDSIVTRHRVSGAVDCHVHVFDPRFPFVAGRSYTPGTATVADLQAHLAGLGVDRTVLIQPSVYGDDNRALLDALDKLGPTTARGIAVIDPAAVTNQQLRALRDAGVTGVRVNLHTKGEDRGQAAVAAVAQTARRVAAFDMVVQIYADLALVAALEETIAASPVPVVLDHFAGARVEPGRPEQVPPGQAALLRLLGDGRVWIKLSAPYRAGRQAPDYPELVPLAHTLVATNPDRLVWASDWPHTGGGTERAGRKPTDIEPFRRVDDARTLALLAAWAGNDTTLTKILVDNPARLFRF